MDCFNISTRLVISFAVVMLLAVSGAVARLGSSVQRSMLSAISQRQIPLRRSLNSFMDKTSEGGEDVSVPQADSERGSAFRIAPFRSYGWDTSGDRPG